MPTTRRCRISSGCKREFPDAADPDHSTTANDAPNGKVGSLEILARDARYDMLLVNDGDILVAPDYLRRVVGLLADRRHRSGHLPVPGARRSARVEGRSAGNRHGVRAERLVARLLSSSGFALGSTMAFRRADLEAIGGFAAIRDYLADDYQLGARISASASVSRWPTRWSKPTSGLAPGKRVEASGALVAHHPRFAPGRILRLRRHAGHVLVHCRGAVRIWKNRTGRNRNSIVRRCGINARPFRATWRAVRGTPSRSLRVRSLVRRHVGQHGRMARGSPSHLSRRPHSPPPRIKS